MNSTNKPVLALFVAMLFITAGSGLVNAQPAPKAKPAVAAADLVPTLEQAYATLSHADHDYGGHRKLAQKDIEEACAALGTKLSSEAGGGESQKTSNLQMLSAQMSLLEVGRSVPDGDAKPKVMNLINRSIKQISLGLQYEVEHGPKAAKVGAGPAPAAAVVAEDPIGGNSVEIASLEEVYKTLALADHDYKGHRVKAMEAIKRATVTLGGAITGDGKAGETQGASDEQMHQAHALLRQVRDSFAAQDPKKVLKDIEVALAEVKTALQIK